METLGKKTLPNNPSETHSYDGKLIKAKTELHIDISRASIIPKESKLDAFRQLKERLRRIPTNQQAEKYLDIIIQTFEEFGHTYSCQNYDPTNDLFADDLLYLCFEQVVIENNIDLAKTLILQLQDMSTGACPQGRTTRLFQILLAYKM